MRLTTPLLAFTIAAASAAAQEQQPATAPAATSEPWTFSFAAYTYHVEGDHDYVQPSVFADRGALHLEARWNYEDLDTASVWAGWNLEAGDELKLEITPMLGVVFGETNGIAPGVRGTLGYGQFELFAESECVIDTKDSDDSFFYTWSELTWSPNEHLRLGVVAQRTRTYETDRDIQRGFLLGLSFERVDVTAHWFNPDESELTLVFSVGFSL